MPKLEVVFRLALNVAIAAIIGFGLSVRIVAPLVLIGMAVTAELAVRPYASNAADKLLLGTGSIVTALILTGLCLNLSPLGLTRGTWTAAWLIISISVLVWRRALRSSIPSGVMRMASRHWAMGLWCLVALVLLVISGAVADAGVKAWNQKPILALSLISEQAHSIVVEIDATSTNGSYRITASSAARHARRYMSPPIAVNAGANNVAVREAIPANASGRWYVYLTDANGGGHLREIIVDVK